MPPVITWRDRVLMRALAQAVRYLTIEQLARLWNTTAAAVRARLRLLTAAGWIRLLRLRARRVAPIRGALFCWKPGEPPPACAQLAYACQSDLVKRPPRQQLACVATPRLCDLYGRPRPPALARKLYQQTHDVGVSEVFLYFMQRWPRLTTAGWRGEDLFAPRAYGEMTEDALILHPHSHQPLLVVEYISRYPKERLLGIHQEMERRQISYRLYH